MFKPFFSLWSCFLPQQETQAEGLLPHPADALLADGLRQQPTPTVNPNFDQNVLAALAKVPATRSRKRAAPRWCLPAVAIASVALVSVLPQTQSIMRILITVVLPTDWVRSGETVSVPKAFPMPPQQAWVTVLPSGANGTGHPVYTSRGGIPYQSSVDGQEAAALLTVLDRWAGQSDFDAAVLRHRLTRTYFPDNRDAENYLASTDVIWTPDHDQRWFAPPSPEDLVRLADAARQREPENAFFVVMAAALRFEKGRNADAVRLIQNLPQTRYWNDYSAEEAVARFRWETFRGDRSSALVYRMFHEDTFPINAIGSVYLNATRYAAAQEQVGNVEQGIAIRLALFDLAEKIARQSGQYVEEATIRDLLETAMAMPSAAGTSLFPEYLLRHHKTAEARRVAQVLRDQQERQHSMSGHRLGFSPPEAELYKLHLFWMVLNLLVYIPLAIWSVAGGLTLARHLPMLRRREEFPAWITIGVTLGTLCEVIVSLFQQEAPFDGLYHLTTLGLTVLAPVLAVLIVGIGYLRLRHPRLIALSAVAAVCIVWFTHVLISALTPLLLRATEAGTYPSSSELRLLDYPVGCIAAPAVLGVGLLAAFALWRKRASTWQIAYQYAAQSTVRVGWYLVLAFSLWCAGVAWQENIFAEACVRQRLSGTILP